MAKIKKGEIKNPKGGKKGPRSLNGLTKAIREQLSDVQRIKVTDANGKGRNIQMTNEEAIARQVIMNARKGNMYAIEFIAERTEGKVKAIHEIHDKRAQLEKIGQHDPSAILARLEAVAARVRNGSGHSKRHRRNTGRGASGRARSA